ncbi:MAG TPA: ATP-binding protein [Mucilaginibacter sp.]|nr:ATP-binding protein [Mucilaginibacter sp.]
MKKIPAAFLLTLLFTTTAFAQKKTIDSLLLKLDKADSRKAKIDVVNMLMDIPNADFALLNHAKKSLREAQAEKDPEKQQSALLQICYAEFSLHDSGGLLDASLQGVRLSRITGDNYYLSRFFHNVSLAYFFAGDNRNSTNYLLVGAWTALRDRDTSQAVTDYSNLESDYAELKKADSALYYAKVEEKLADQFSGKNKSFLQSTVWGDKGEALATAGELKTALTYYLKAYRASQNQAKTSDQPFLLNNLAKTYLQISRPDSAFKYAKESFDQASQTKMWEFTADAAGILSKIYDRNDYPKSLYYLRAEMAARDSINANQKSRQFQLIADRDQEREADLKAAQERYDARVRLLVVIGAVVVFLFISIILWRNNRKQKQTNLLLSEQKEEIAAQRDNLDVALQELKTTQTQLVLREKMASLGELTAGIAHEIQNPLNFVNNFSDVSIELLDELKEEEEKGNKEDVIAIADDLIQNLEKIRHHGQRADAIVKGMLQHSRVSSGQKEPTDINALADEYLRLAYHGLRAKDKDFNAELITYFDDKLPKVEAVPQDIGRVLLNVINNAFYALQQKAKTARGSYKPEVAISTVQQNGSITISVKDNGDGIPKAIKDKIMQPFFTTKPTGEGTGLGLSLSYDIVVKGHGGSITVESKEGDGSEFVIQLPVN